MDSRDPTFTLLTRIAQRDPEYAFALLQGKPEPVSYSCAATFQGGSIGDTEQAALDNGVSFSTWVDDFSYTIGQPNAFSGSVLQNEAQVAKEQIPGIDARVTVVGSASRRMRYVLDQNFKPVQLVARPSTVPNGPHMRGWMLYPSEVPQVELQLTQTLRSDENPTTITFNFECWIAGCLLDDPGSSTYREFRRFQNELTLSEAISGLQGLGILPPGEAFAKHFGMGRLPRGA
jgi:hypothetical protein